MIDPNAADESTSLPGQEVFRLKTRVARTFPTGSTGKAIEADRLLIPVTGELAGELTTIFYGAGAYRAGPFRSASGTQDLLQALIRLGVVKPA